MQRSSITQLSFADDKHVCFPISGVAAGRESRDAYTHMWLERHADGEVLVVIDLRVCLERVFCFVGD